MKELLTRLNNVISELEVKGKTAQADNLEKIFVKIASDGILFDPRQKGSDLDDLLAKDPFIEPMKYQKKKFKVKVRRIK